MYEGILSGRDGAILAACLALVVLHVVAMVRGALPANWFRLARRSVARVYVLVRQRKCADFCEVEGAVRNEVQAVALEIFHKAAGVYSLLFGLLISFILFQISTGVERFHSLGQDIVVLVVYSIHIILRFFPGSISGRMICIWYSILMAMNCLYITPPFCGPNYPLPLATIMPMGHAFGLSLALVNSAVAVVWTGIYLCTVVVTIFHRDENDMLLCFWFVLSGCFAASICVCTAGLQEHLEATARRDIETKSLKEKETACNALLRIFYDVVLELDSALRIKSSGQELAAFLGSNPGRSLNGTLLGELVPDTDDQQLLGQRMGQAPSQEAMAQVMHLALRDGHRDSRKVELLSFQFEGPGGRTSHLVGIREFGDETVPGHLAGDPPVERSFLPEELAALGDLTIKVDAARPDLRVLECSDNFQYVMGTSIPGRSLFTLVEAGQQLQDWYQDVMNLHLAGESCEVVERANTCIVRLRPWGEPSVRIMANCCVGLEESADEADASNSCASFAVCLVFSNLKREVVVGRHCGSLSSFTLGSCWSAASSSSSGSTPKRKRKGTPSKIERSRLGSDQGGSHVIEVRQAL